jgi:hypothetical protein
MSRTENICQISLKHLQWRDDSLAVQFAKMKNDQEGDTLITPRRNYANPFNPYICPIFSMGIYLLLMNLDGDGKLFPGDRQSARFSNI